MPKTKYTTEVEGPNGYVFRIKAAVYGRGSHVRAMLYSGKKGRTFALNGTLNFRDPEFSDFCSLLGVDEEHEWEAETEKCPECGQVDHGQVGEYHCSTCGLPTVHDSLPENEQPV